MNAEHSTPATTTSGKEGVYATPATGWYFSSDEGTATAYVICSK